MLIVIKYVAEVHCQVVWVLKDTGTSGNCILEEVIFELNNIQFNLKNKHG